MDDHLVLAKKRVTQGEANNVFTRLQTSLKALADRLRHELLQEHSLFWIGKKYTPITRQARHMSIFPVTVTCGSGFRKSVIIHPIIPSNDDPCGTTRPCVTGRNSE